MRPNRSVLQFVRFFCAGVATLACSADPPALAPAATGGSADTATGGAPGPTGGTPSTPTGGSSTGGKGSGGAPGSGGATASGGSSAMGGAPASGGVTATGGVTGSGGAIGTGGVPSESGGAAGHGPDGAGGVDDSGSAGAAGSTGTGGVPCPTAACGNTNHDNERCSDTDSVGLSKYQLLTNLWGEGNAESGSQCTWTLCDTNGKVAWGTEFDWTSPEDISVKSYVAAILGWHWNSIPAGTGLPIQLSDDKSIPCTWGFKLDVDAEASLNVAWDLWLSPDSNPSQFTQPSDEVMVWVHRQNKEDPIGYEDGVQDTVTVGDADWDLYRGNNGGNEVYSYLRVGTSSCATVDLKDFLDDLVTREWVDPAKYLISVESGPEVVRGTGTLITETYSCVAQ